MPALHLFTVFFPLRQPAQRLPLNSSLYQTSKLKTFGIFVRLIYFYFKYNREGNLITFFVIIISKYSNTNNTSDWRTPTAPT